MPDNNQRNVNSVSDEQVEDAKQFRRTALKDNGKYRLL
jgi:hypothetical protein